MPTGYTEILKDKKYDVKKWLKEDIIRQFGLLACMRGDKDCTEKEIIAKLTELTNHKLEKPEPINDIDLEKEYKKHIKYYSDKLKETEKNYIGYKKSVKILHKLFQYPKTTLTYNIVKFAINQLDLIRDDFDFDIKFSKEQLTLSFEDFKNKKQEDYKIKLGIYNEDIEKDKILHKERLYNYLQFVKEIDDLFKKIESEEN